MKKFKLYTYTVVFVLLSFNLSSQSFCGNLIYNFHTNDYERMSILEQYGVDIMTEFQNTYEIIQINDDSLYSKVYSYDSIFLGKGMQQYDSLAFIYSDKDFSTHDFEEVYKSGLDYKLIKKTDEIDTILGTVCYKYIYKQTNQPKKFETVLHVWIPNNYKFSKSYSYDKFFNLFFFKNGLAFKKEMFYKGTIRTWTLTDIKVNSEH